MSRIKEFNFTDRQGRDIHIRNAVPDDAEQINKIKRDIIDERYFMLREPFEAKYTKEKTAEEIIYNTENEGALYIVAEHKSKVVGELDFINGSLFRTKHCGSFTVFISKDFRDSGLGIQLIQALISWAEKDPLIEKITLNAFSINIRALKLYEKCGFITEGYCPKDMKLDDGSYIDSVLMYKFVK